MIPHAVTTKAGLKEFYALPGMIYRNRPCYRKTAEDTVQQLVGRPAAFHTHARIKPFLLCSRGEPVARFVLVNDSRLPEWVQTAFFEALPGLNDPAALIRHTASSEFPDCRKLVVGLNGHLNYGAGILLDHFDEIPYYETTYNPSYYGAYFSAFRQRTIVSYPIDVAPFLEYLDKATPADWEGITTRFMNKRRFREEIGLYTDLNNACFGAHPYWAERSRQEDYELFAPFRSFMDNENLIFAEAGGKTAGYLFWYPDFNQLVKKGQTLGLRQWLRFRLASPVTRFRFMEIAVLPDRQISRISLAMIHTLGKVVRKAGFTRVEGGFIFTENGNSIRLATRYIYRVLGENAEPARHYAVFEADL